MAGKKRRARLQKKFIRRRQALFVLFIFFSFFLIHGLWIGSHSLVKVKKDQVESIDLMVLPDRQSVRVSREEDLARIVKKLRQVTGHPQALRGSSQTKVYFIHINQKNRESIDLTKSGDQLGMNGNWYRVKKSDLRRIDGIFAAYFKDL